MKQQQTVFVGLSGGVDSSVAALRLKNQGYNVVGVFIKVWQPDFLACNWEAERLDAMRVAAHLEIPFLTCDGEAAYRDEVGKYFIAEYKAGRTPNPDVMCNQHVKFGVFLEFARAHKADFVATGHYAQKTTKSSKSDFVQYGLVRGNDDNKDQSYFLWTLRQDQLQHILLPVGDTPKEQIRIEAEKAGIPIANKKDSQGVCFLGHIDIPEFLSHFIELVPGPVLDESGKTIGVHTGALVYTVGQRHGFTITSADTDRAPYFVIEKNVGTNTITVSKRAPLLQKNSTVTLTNTNWIPTEIELGTYEAQFRYRQQPFSIEVTQNTKTTTTLKLEAATEATAVGQSCVLYRGTKCLGGGIIS